MAVCVSLYHISNAAGALAIAISAIASTSLRFAPYSQPIKTIGEACILATAPLLLALWLRSLRTKDHSAKLCIACNLKTGSPALKRSVNQLLSSSARFNIIGYSLIAGHIFGIGLLAASKFSLGNPKWIPAMNRVGIACAIIGNLGILLFNLRDKPRLKEISGLDRNNE
ncbi:MAG: hypothetical protein H7A40_06615 [Chlamydiales bacterium]|nr:hypothetical protein [Chlamydiales bacterium]